MFFSLILVFCKMFDAIPEDQAFAQLIITQMATYHDKCCAWYTGMNPPLLIYFYRTVNYQRGFFPLDKMTRLSSLQFPVSV